MKKSLNILIADDEALIRLDLKEMLTDAGHNVLAEAGNGQEALELARKYKPELIIMDVKMPVMDGLQAAEILNEENIAPIILLTAYSQPDIVQQATQAGVIAYLVKPVREEQLFPAIQIAVDRFHDFQQLNKELDDLKESLEVRKLVDKAKGILMAAHGMTEQEAYRKLQQFSMVKRISLKKLAESVIAAAEHKG